MIETAASWAVIALAVTALGVFLLSGDRGGE